MMCMTVVPLHWFTVGIRAPRVFQHLRGPLRSRRWRVSTNDAVRAPDSNGLAPEAAR